MQILKGIFFKIVIYISLTDGFHMQHNLRKAVSGKGRHYENFITRKTVKKCANNLCKYFHKLQVYTFKKVYVQKHFTLFPLNSHLYLEFYANLTYVFI